MREGGGRKSEGFRVQNYSADIIGNYMILSAPPAHVRLPSINILLCDQTRAL